MFIYLISSSAALDTKISLYIHKALSHVFFILLTKFRNLISNRDITKPNCWLPVALPLSKEKLGSFENDSSDHAHLSRASPGVTTGTAGWDSTLVDLSGMLGGVPLSGILPPTS